MCVKGKTLKREITWMEIKEKERLRGWLERDTIVTLAN